MCKDTLSIVIYPLHEDLSCKNSERQAEAAGLHWVYGVAWEWIWDRFSSVTMHFNGTVPLPLILGVFIPLHKVRRKSK